MMRMVKKLWIAVIVAALSVSAFGVSAAEQQVAGSFKDVPAGHWAASVIREAVGKGYVAGYPDGTFKPDRNVTRAEFMKMLVSALGLPHSQGGSPWYQPYNDALRKTGILNDDDFHFLNYDAPITRLELIRLAVKALDPEHIGKEEIELVRTAAETGLLRGMDGELKLSGRTTRAQAVAFMERLLALRAGETLSVDHVALAQAEALEADPWGRVIRTTNLPKNAADYPYILESIPNAMYEMGYNERFFPNGLGLNSVQFHERFKSYTRENIEKWLPLAERWLNLAVNVDYRTIDKNWVNEMIKLGNFNVRHDAVTNFYTRYVEKVRKEKIQIVGHIRLEPSIIVYSSGLDFMRAKVEFKIVSAENPKDVFFMSFQPKEGFEIGKWYRGYADIALGNMVVHPDMLTDMRVGHVYTDLFWNYDFKIKE